MTNTMRALWLASLLGYVLLLAGCPSKLSVQQSLAQRVHRATVQCTALPATIGDKPNPQKVRVCTDALLCQSSAGAAVTAMQDAQKATASGSTDIAVEAKSAGLGALADVACKRGGW